VTTYSRRPGGAAQSADLNHRHRIRSISFDLGDAEWVDGLVDLLREAGYPKAARAQIVRAALQELHFIRCWQRALARKSSSSR
jgi:hypothetical protein